MKRYSKCPYCGGSYYTLKSYVTGVVSFNKAFKDNKPDWNDGMYDYLNYKDNIYLTCFECGKKIAKVKDYDMYSTVVVEEVEDNE